MAFSVLMSLYAKERPDHLRLSLDSVFAQTLPPDEVVLVEDGPLTDELNSVVHEFQSKHQTLKIVALEVNGGLGRALNEGLKHCSFDLVARMDTDDICYPNRFEKQVEVFERFPEVQVVNGWLDEFEEDPNVILKTRKLPEFNYELFQYGKKQCPVYHPVVMFRKDAVLFAGGYRHFPLFEDYYLWVRLLMNGAKFYTVQESLLKFRISAGTFKRRGGIKHAFNEFSFQRHMRRMRYISRTEFFSNVIVRFIYRVIPGNIRELAYKRFLK